MPLTRLYSQTEFCDEFGCEPKPCVRTRGFSQNVRHIFLLRRRRNDFPFGFRIEKKQKNVTGRGRENRIEWSWNTPCNAFTFFRFVYIYIKARFWIFALQGSSYYCAYKACVDYDVASSDILDYTYKNIIIRPQRIYVNSFLFPSRQYHGEHIMYIIMIRRRLYRWRFAARRRSWEYDDPWWSTMRSMISSSSSLPQCRKRTAVE